MASRVRLHVTTNDLVPGYRGALLVTDGAGSECVEDSGPSRCCRRSPGDRIVPGRSWRSGRELGPRWQARQDARQAERPRRRAIGAVARHRLVLTDRLLARRTCMRLPQPMAALQRSDRV